MCGITGIVHSGKQSVDQRVLKRMTDAVTHRGPDGEGFYTDAQCGLGHRRLSIIDLSAAADQPMRNREGDLHLTYNGEIYNYRELRVQLEQFGRRFRTVSDTEVILQGYAHWGAGVVQHLRGMFAFAIWDTRNSQKPILFIARDRVGKKPLWYTLLNTARAVPTFTRGSHASDPVATHRTLLFGSSLNALLAYPNVPRTIDRTALWHFLSYGYIPAPSTIFHGIRKLPPAHTLTFSPADGAMKIEQYWQLRYDEHALVGQSESALCAEIRERLAEAVRLRLRSDVPLGAFLSGGIDSSSVVAMMATEAVAESLPTVKTYTIGFSEQDYDERRYAKMVAEQFRTDHHEFTVEMSAANVLPTLIWHYGEPYGDSSALPSYYLAQQTRQNVTVALNGDGGDESFGGYSRYALAALMDRYRRIPKLLQKPFSALIRAMPDRVPPALLIRRAKRFVQVAHAPVPEGYAKLMQVLDDDTKRTLTTSAFAADQPNSDTITLEAFRTARDLRASPPITTMLAADVQRYLPDDLLVKMDVAISAHGLEGRSPYLDHELMEFAARIPPTMKLRGTTTKYILKRAFAGILPKQILHRTKQGFGIPINAWFRGEFGEMAETALLSDRAARRGHFDAQVLSRFIREHRRGKANHGYALWNMLWLELWQRMYVDQDPPRAPPADLRTLL